MSRVFEGPATDARPKPGDADYNVYVHLFNEITNAPVPSLARRLLFSQRHHIADHLFKVGYRKAAPMVSYLERYVQERGIGMPFYTNGSKITEEAAELRDAILSGDVQRIKEEAADVCITALVAARQHGFTIEEALEAKIAKDAGRGPKLNDPNEQGGARS